MIKKVLEAKKLLEKKTSMSKVSVIVGINRQALQPLVDLYDELSAQPVKPSSSDYVCIRKQKYISLSIKIQHKLNDMRLEYWHMQKELDRAKGKFIRAKHDYGERKRIIEELEQKQLMLNVTSSNLQHAEDGYDYLKMNYKWDMFYSFMGGIAFFLGVIYVVGHYFAKISIVY